MPWHQGPTFRVSDRLVKFFPTVVETAGDDDSFWDQVRDRIEASFSPEEAEKMLRSLGGFDRDEVEDWLSQLTPEAGGYLPDEMIEIPPADDSIVPIDPHGGRAAALADTMVRLHGRIKPKLDWLIDALDGRGQGRMPPDYYDRIEKSVVRLSVYVKNLPDAARRVRAGNPTRSDLNLLLAVVEDPGIVQNAGSMLPKNVGPVADWARAALTKGTGAEGPTTARQAYAEKERTVLDWIRSSGPVHKSEVARMITKVYGKNVKNSRFGPYGTIGRWKDSRKIEVDGGGMVSIGDPATAGKFNSDRVSAAIDDLLAGRDDDNGWNVIYAVKYAIQGIGKARAAELIRPRLAQLRSMADKEHGLPEWERDVTRMLKKLGELLGTRLNAPRLESFFPHLVSESAGNIVRLLKVSPEFADIIHTHFGPLDFPVAKLMLSVGRFDAGAIALDPEKDMRRASGPGWERADMDLVFDETVGELCFKLGITSADDDLPGGDIRDLLKFLRGNQAIIPRINSTPVGPGCLDIAHQALLMKKRSLADLKTIVKLGDGWAWVDLGSCQDGPESIEMQHCGQDQRGHLVSLRDPHNSPHVTMTYDGKTVYQIKGKQNTVPVRKYWGQIMAFFKVTGAGLHDEWLRDKAQDEFDTQAPEAADLLKAIDHAIARGREG